MIQISFRKYDHDERSNKKSNIVCYVSYENNDIEIDGYLKSENTNLIFEPNYFIDIPSEDYYDENWEDIELEILNEYKKWIDKDQ